MTDAPPLCTSAQAVTADWLQRALAAGGAVGAPALRGVEVRALASATNAFGELLRCRLTTGDDAPGVPETVIVKLPTARAGAARFARRLALHRREYVFYRHLARRVRVRTPALLYGDWDERSDRFVLVLEDLRPMTPGSQIDGIAGARARHAILELAGLHGQYWNQVDHPHLAHCRAVLGAADGRFLQPFYWWCLARLLDRFGDCFPAHTLRLAESLGARLTEQLAAVAAGPRTFMHGDYRAENLFYGAGDEFAVIDWQGSGIGSGLYDVAYFLASSVVTEERRRLEREALEEYHATVCRIRGGAEDFTLAACWRSYRQNLLSVLITCVLGCGGLELTMPRYRDLARAWLERTLAAIEDLEADEFLPARRRHWSLSHGAYRGYRGMRRLVSPRRSVDG